MSSLVREAGPSAGGEPVVCLHGVPASCYGGPHIRPDGAIRPQPELAERDDPARRTGCKTTAGRGHLEIVSHAARPAPRRQLAPPGSRTTAACGDIARVAADASDRPTKGK